MRGRTMIEELIEPMRDARRRTLALVEDLPDEKLTVSKLDIVNPFLWELGHVTFFHDAFILGYLDGDPPLLQGAERIYDSFKVDHDDRWDLPLPDRAATLDYMQRDRCASFRGDRMHRKCRQSYYAFGKPFRPSARCYEPVTDKIIDTLHD